MYETTVEKNLQKKIKALGGECLKWVCPGRRGAPDRICLFPVKEQHKKVVAHYVKFIELKKPGGRAEPHQIRFHENLRALGFEVEVVDE